MPSCSCSPAWSGAWPRARPIAAFLTCAPNTVVGAIHPKAMPVILNGAAIDAWLTGDAAAAPALPMANELMQVIPWKLSIDRAPATFGHDPGLSAGLREGPRGTPRGADRWTPVARTRPINWRKAWLRHITPRRPSITKLPRSRIAVRPTRTARTITRPRMSTRRRRMATQPPRTPSRPPRTVRAPQPRSRKKAGAICSGLS